MEEDAPDFEAVLAEGLCNVMAHGNSHMRRLAASSLSKLRFLGRFHAGADGVCRINWGPTIQLDDCTCQQLAIGNLHFQVIDYGGGDYTFKRVYAAKTRSYREMGGINAHCWRERQA